MLPQPTGVGSKFQLAPQFVVLKTPIASKEVYITAGFEGAVAKLRIELRFRLLLMLVQVAPPEVVLKKAVVHWVPLQLMPEAQTVAGTEGLTMMP